MIISKNKKILEKISWEINQNFVEGLGNAVVIKININNIFKVSETRKYFFIYKDKAENLPIPKAQISDDDLKSIKIFFEERMED